MISTLHERVYLRWLFLILKFYEVLLAPWETSQISKVEFFCGNRWRMKAADYFGKKNSILNVWLGSKYVSELRNSFEILFYSFMTEVPII